MMSWKLIESTIQSRNWKKKKSNISQMQTRRERMSRDEAGEVGDRLEFKMCPGYQRNQLKQMMI